MTGTPSGPLRRPGPAEQPGPGWARPTTDPRDIELGDDGTAQSAGRVALVTGAARGIGRASARRLAEAGWRVVLVDVPAPLTTVDYALSGLAELTEATAACLAAARRLGGQRVDGPPASPLPAKSVPEAVGVIADVRRRADLDVAVATAHHYYGRLDAVVAAAGILAGGWTLWETPLPAYEDLLAVNLTGVFHLIGAAMPGLTSGPGRDGRIVVVASGSPLVGRPRLGAYSAAKAGVVGLVRTLAAELGPQGVTVNAVCPGPTRGPVLEVLARVHDLRSIDDLAAHHLSSAPLDPDDPAALIAWLCHPDSRAVNGAVLPVDVGFSAHLGAPSPAGSETGPPADG